MPHRKSGEWTGVESIVPRSCLLSRIAEVDLMGMLAPRPIAGALLLFATIVLAPRFALAQKGSRAEGPPFPPKLPGGESVVTVKSDDFLKPTETLRAGVAVAKTAPTVDFAYLPGQDYPGNPWSNWGDSLAVNGKYYASIGDHLAIGPKAGANGTGTGRVFEYDPQSKAFRLLCDVSKTLAMPEGHYTPGKIHGRLDLGSDGWIYFSTHRGSTRVTTDQYHYRGDWILRCNPATGQSEVVAQGPVPNHCIPNSILDPDRLIFYGGTAPGDKGEDSGIQFFAYDVKNRRLLYSGPDGPARAMIFAKSTGRIYYTPGTRGNADGSELMRFHPDENGGKPVRVDGVTIGLRAATLETPQGVVYTVSQNERGADSTLWQFNTKTEEATNLGPAPVGTQSYITTIDADPTGRFLYYIPGAHGGAERDGTPVVQFDTKTSTKKVIAFLHPHFEEKHDATLRGTFSSAVDPKGDKLYINWNVSRGSKAWDSCALTVIHIPESERGEVSK